MTRSLALLLTHLSVPAVRRGTRGRWLLAAASVAGPGGCAAFEEPQPNAPAAARIVRVVDGDTIVVRSGGRVTVRLIGIDTPETHRGAVECGGLMASASSHGSPLRAAAYGSSPTPARATRTTATDACSRTSAVAGATSANGSCAPGSP